jgi:rRNA-processing protein Efg1
MVNVKPLTKHGLDRKFKPWRRGKSEKSNKRSSLKQQLRGIERLLTKLPDDQSERRDELHLKIRALKLEIDEKQKVILEKNNAEKAHGQRFLDRQRLTRMEKQLCKRSDSSEKEFQLLKIALDQVYVAHHPTDIKYLPLFRKGQRVIDTSRHLYRRAVTRRRILTALTKDKQTCTWISKEQYERLPSTEWKIQDEERVFGGSITRQGMKEVKKKLKEATDDSRFALAPAHNTVLQMAKQMDAEFNSKEGKKGDEKESDSEAEASITEGGGSPARDDESDRSSSSSDDDEDDGPDPMDRFRMPSNASAATSDDRQIPILGDSSDSSDSDSSSSSDDDDSNAKEPATKDKQPSDGSSSTSDDSSDSSSEDKEKMTEEVKDEQEIDDFLLDANDDVDDGNVFAMTLKQVPALGEVHGDKSKGWQTQKQRPGQVKKQRMRR